MKRRLDCDLILEGAVVSAIVYLALIAGLSRRYRFCSLGGASSGSAVAAAAAVAEALRIKSGSDAGFRGLFRFALWLGKRTRGRSNLLGLFQPAPALRLPFRVLVAFFALQASNPAAGSRLGRFARSATLVFLASLVLAALGQYFPPAAQACRAYLLTILEISVVPGALAVLLVCRWLKAFADQHFGLCTGMPTADADAAALTRTLHELYQKLLGRTAEVRPVIFDELWKCGPPPPGAQRAVDLQVVTTVLHQRRSLHLPGQPGEDPLRDYFYDPEEWQQFFPAAVMDWLRQNARQTVPVEFAQRAGGRPQARTLLALPEPAKLPVIVAVRLSVSFPGLLSAIPLYTLAQGHGFVRPENGEPARFQPLKVYFTDGGLTSNLPIDFFDEALPRWPTFGVNLFELDAKAASGETAPNVFFGARRREPETRPMDVTRRPDGRPSLLSFLAELVFTAKDWRDITRRSLPGVRERVLHIGLPRGFGALNLGMSRKQVLQLVRLGSSAARHVVSDFSLPAAPGRASRWEEHRWLRLRTALAAAQKWLRPLSAAVRQADTLQGQPGYRDLLGHPRPPGPDFPDEATLRQARALLDGLDAAGVAAAGGPDLGAHLPEGTPRLQLGPPP
jgi:hypothetical protein